MKKRFLASKVFSSVAALCLFAGCASSNSGVTGAAAGDTTKNANTKIERCSQTLGTLSFYEDQSSSWCSYLTRDYQLGSTGASAKDFSSANWLLRHRRAWQKYG